MFPKCLMIESGQAAFSLWDDRPVIERTVHDGTRCVTLMARSTVGPISAHAPLQVCALCRFPSPEAIIGFPR
jgi:hypothetical protein